MSDTSLTTHPAPDGDRVDDRPCDLHAGAAGHPFPARLRGRRRPVLRRRVPDPGPDARGLRPAAARMEPAGHRRTWAGSRSPTSSSPGAMVVAAALGLNRAWTTGRGHRAAPILIAIYGVSPGRRRRLHRRPDARLPGRYAGRTARRGEPGTGSCTSSSGGVGFACLIAACLVIGRRFRRQGRAGLAWFSRITGVLFLAGFGGVVSGATSPGVNLAFTAAVRAGLDLAVGAAACTSTAIRKDERSCDTWYCSRPRAPTAHRPRS